MTLKVSTWLAVAITGGAFVAGCGGSSGGSSSTSSQTTSAGQTTGPGTSVVGQQDVAGCKHSIQSQAQLSASAKARLEKICEKAANGNPATLQQVAHEACVELVNASHVPAGVSRQEALAICKDVKTK
jgi:hypothetical protein